MPIQRSPFSSSGSDSGSSEPIVGQVDKKRASNIDALMAGTGGKPVDAAKFKAPEGLKTSQFQEEQKLDKSFITSRNKIMMSSLSAKDKQAKIKSLESIYNSGKSTGGLFNKLEGGLRAIGGKVMDVSAAGARVLQSAAKELDDETVANTTNNFARTFRRLSTNPLGAEFVLQDILKTKEQKAKEAKAGPPKASVSEFVSQIKNKDFKMIETGRKGLDTAIDFGNDVLTDPLTYTGVGEAGLIGKAGRNELLVKFGTKEMMTKYPELAGTLDDIARYGATALPKTVREAEGIKLGVRFGGQVVPKTEFIQQAFSGRKGIASNARALIGDTIDAVGGNKLRVALTPASRAGMVAKQVGRAQGLEDKTIVQEIANMTSHRWAKGFKNEQFDKAVSRIKSTLQTLRKSDPEVVDNFYKYVENPGLMDVHGVKDEVRSMVSEYRTWQDSLRTEVNAVYEKFNADFGPNSMKPIGFIDDFLHHKITPEALDLAYNPKSKFAKFFASSDLSPIELGTATGTAMYRKLKVGEKFMGETIDMAYDGVQHESLVDVVNYIFKKKTGTDVNFFSTDIFDIAQSYSYSIATARGREAYFRRMYDFGGDFIQNVAYKHVPDRELVKGLQGTHNALLKTRAALTRNFAKGKVALGDTMENAVKTATAILDNAYTRPRAALQKQVDAAVQKLNELEFQHLGLLAKAAERNAKERGAFVEAHNVILQEIRDLRAALEAGQIDQVAAYDRLKEVWVKTFPNRKVVPKDPQKMIDDINMVRGVSDTRQLRELEKRLKGLRQQIESVPPEDIQQLNELLDLEQKIVSDIQGHQRLADVKMGADYAPDGMVYGFSDAVVPAPNTPDAPAYRVLSTNPHGVRLPDNATSDEIASARHAFMTDPEAVAVHAPHGNDIVDLRRVEDFGNFFDPEGPMADGIVTALDRAGLDSSVLKDAWDELLNDGSIDPMLEQIYPEVSDMLSTVSAIFTADFGEGVVDDTFLTQSLQALHDSFANFAGSQGLENSDLVGGQMFDDFMGYMAEQTGKPVLVPDSILMNTNDGYSLVVPNSWEMKAKGGDLKGSTTSSVQYVADSPFVQEILNGDLESAALAASSALTDVTDRTLTLEGFKTVQAQAYQASRDVAGLKSAGTRRVKQAEAAYKEWVDKGVLSLNIEGRKVKLTREQALDALNMRENLINTKVAKMEDSLARQTGREVKGVQNRMRLQRERVASLMDQATVLERWNETAGKRLREEIDLLREDIALNPIKGQAGAVNRGWAEKVGRQIRAIDKMNGTVEYDAYNRVFTQLFADEAQLAFLDFQQLPAIEGRIASANLAKLVPDINKGWTQIKNTGMQVPDELHDVMFPNVQKLLDKVEAGKVKKAWLKYQQAFKIYATMSLGFITRNALSAAFMNHVAGVDAATMVKGVDAAIAYKKFGPDRWLDELGIVEPKMRDAYESAMRATHATGRGMSTEFESPVARGGFFDKKILNNKAVKLHSAGNDFVELSVRFPMALDTILKGGSYDNAVYKVTRYHFDYSDLSKVDDIAKKNFVPFWVWTTRNIPLQLTEQILRPSTYSIYEKAKEHYPVSADIMMPAWLSETSPIGLKGNWVLNPDLPMNRLSGTIAQFADPKRLVGQMYPNVKMPIEVFLADKKLATDIPFTDKFGKARGVDKLVAGLAEIVDKEGKVTRRDKEGNLLLNPRWSYAISSLIPTLAQAQRLSGGAAGGSETYDEKQLSSILSWLGVPARRIGTREQRSAAISRQFDIGSLMKQIGRQEQGG